MKKQVQLCTYIDRFGMGDINTLRDILSTRFAGIFGSLHLLPFYFPIDGADAGFDPIDHAKVDPRLGSWKDINLLSNSYEIMADVIVNHMSSKSLQFADYLKLGEDSPYESLFLTFDKVFPHGATEADILSLYRPRPGLPFSRVKFENGQEKMLWTTFTSEQIDIDVHSQQGQAYLKHILTSLQDAKVTMIRLDAAGYAVKRAGSSCFMTDETFEFINEFSQQANQLGMEVLVEIHSHYLTQIEISKKTQWVYDFALPPLVLHTLTAGDSLPLQEWYKIAPRNAINVLDTHDGIGIIDVATDRAVGPGLLSNEQVNQLVVAIHQNSQGQSLKATGEAANNVDLYQVNCTYYAALGCDDTDYLLARLIQMFSPGIPQIYYVGLLAGENDMQLLADTGIGRDINRTYYSIDEIDQALTRPVVRHTLSLINLRNRHRAFLDGEFGFETSDGSKLKIIWQAPEIELCLSIDLNQRCFTIQEKQKNQVREVERWEDIDVLAK